MARRDFNSKGWREVCRDSPCKACGRSRGCREARDGANICWRVPSAVPRGAGWWHPGGGELAESLPPVVVQAQEIADAALLHEVYQQLLELCPLSTAHRKHLHNEGWTAEEIHAFRCGSLPEHRSARKPILRELHLRFGPLLAQVPGFLLREGTRETWAELCAPAGLLIACSGWDGRIQRLRVRPERSPSDEGSKYVWLSSSRHGGPSSGSPAAFFRPNDLESPRRLLITEGEKKAYLAAQRLASLGLPAVGVSLAGVGNYGELLPVLEQQAPQFDEIVIAFDVDEKPETRRRVALHEKGLAEALAGRGFPVLLARWSGAKGIDDLLVAGGKPVLEAHAAKAALPCLEDAPERARPKPAPVWPSPPEKSRWRMSLDEARVWAGVALRRCFSAEDPGNKVFLLRGQPGLGKTHLLTDFCNELASRKHFRSKRLVNVTPRHDFADERRKGWNIVTGLDYQATPAAALPCHQQHYVKQAQELGIPRQEICQRCPLQQACKTNHARNPQQPYYLAMINSPEKRWQVNQNLLGVGRNIWMNQRLGLLTLDDVDLWGVSVQEKMFSWDVLRTALAWCDRDSEYFPLQQLLELLLDAGRQLDPTDTGAELFERDLFQVLEKLASGYGVTLDEVIQKAKKAKEPQLFLEGQSLEGARWNIPPRFRDALLQALEREYAQYQKGPLEGWNRSLYLQRSGVKLYEAQPLDSPQLIGVPIVIASASMTAEQVRLFFPGRKVEVIEPELEVPTGVRIVQHVDKGFGKTSLQSEPDFARVRRELEKVRERHPGQRLGLVTHKFAAERLKAHLPEYESLHYYAQRGSNALKHCEALVVMGTPCPNPEELRRQCEAFHPQEPKVRSYSVLRQHRIRVKGERLRISYRAMGDRRLQSWLEARREQELFQAVGRARLYDTEDATGIQGLLEFEDNKLPPARRESCTIYVYTNVPIPGVEVHHHVSEIGKRLQAQKVVTLSRIERLQEAILKLRAGRERITQVRLAEETGLTVKMVRRLYYPALAAVERRREAERGVVATRPRLPFAGRVLTPAEPLLESRVGLPPPSRMR